MDTEEDAAAPSREAVLEHIWSLMRDGQPRRAKEIATELGKQGLVAVDKSLVNSVLAREGKGSYVYDTASYTYRVGDATESWVPPVVADATEETMTREPREKRDAVGDANAPSAPRNEVLAGVLRLLAEGPPRTAKQLATELLKGGLAGVDKSQVNSVLAREGKDVVEYDRAAFTYSLAAN